MTLSFLQRFAQLALAHLKQALIARTDLMTCGTLATRKSFSLKNDDLILNTRHVCRIVSHRNRHVFKSKNGKVHHWEIFKVGLEQTAIPMTLCMKRERDPNWTGVKNMQRRQQGNEPVNLTTFVELATRTRIPFFRPKIGSGSTFSIRYQSCRENVLWIQTPLCT